MRLLRIGQADNPDWIPAAPVMARIWNRTGLCVFARPTRPEVREEPTGNRNRRRCGCRRLSCYDSAPCVRRTWDTTSTSIYC
jgi:hypothetical protein